MSGLLVVTAIASLEASENSRRPEAGWRAEPQIVTSRRLLKLGESIEFRFWLPPEHDTSACVEVFPCYLERVRPGATVRVTLETP